MRVDRARRAKNLPRSRRAHETRSLEWPPVPGGTKVRCTRRIQASSKSFAALLEQLFARPTKAKRKPVSFRARNRQKTKQVLQNESCSGFVLFWFRYVWRRFPGVTTAFLRNNCFRGCNLARLNLLQAYRQCKVTHRQLSFRTHIARVRTGTGACASAWRRPKGNLYKQ